MTDDKKNLLDKVIDAVSNRDEKAAAEAARLEALAKAETQARANMAAQEKATADARAKAEADAKAKALAEAQAKAAADAQARAVAEQKLAEAERQERLKAEQETRAAESARIAAEKAAWAALPRHKVTPDETLGAIALKYYGHAAEPYWRVIYNANKDTIGANPGVIRPGTELVIPNLPADLKK